MSTHAYPVEQPADTDVGSSHMSLALRKRVVTLNHALKAMNDGLEQLFVHAQEETAQNLSVIEEQRVRASHQADHLQTSVHSRDEKSVENKVVNRGISQSAAWARSVLSRLDVITSKKSSTDSGEQG